MRPVHAAASCQAPCGVWAGPRCERTPARRAVCTALPRVSERLHRHWHFWCGKVMVALREDFRHVAPAALVIHEPEIATEALAPGTGSARAEADPITAVHTAPGLVTPR